MWKNVHGFHGFFTHLMVLSQQLNAACHFFIVITNSIRHIVAATLVLVFLVSVIGVAQVSHFCLMAKSETGLPGCDSDCNSSAGCCEMPSGNQPDSFSRQPCCVEVVKYYQNATDKFLAGHSNELLQAIAPFTSIFMMAPVLPQYDDLVYQDYISPSLATGNTILISIHRFLI
jgi:hypothetical protein